MWLVGIVLMSFTSCIEINYQFSLAVVLHKFIITTQSSSLALVAISKSMRAVKLCTNQLEVPANAG